MNRASAQAEEAIVLSHGHIELAAVPAGFESELTHEDQIYGDPAGSADLRGEIAAWTTRQTSTELSAEQVVVTAGARAALALTLLAVQSDRPDVVVLAPCWPTYRPLVELAGRNLRIVHPPEQSGDPYQGSTLDEAFDRDVAAVILNSPRNPDWEIASAAAITAILERAQASNATLIFDQVYRGLSPLKTRAPSPLDLAGSVPDGCVIVDGLSKTFGLAGLRIGWALVPAGAQSSLGVGSASVFAPASSVAQRAASSVLAGDGLDSRCLAEIDRNRAMASAFLDGLPGVTCIDPGAGIFLFPDFSETGHDTAELAVSLRDQKRVSVLCGESFGTEGRLRISVALESAKLGVGLERIASGIGETVV